MAWRNVIMWGAVSGLISVGLGLFGSSSSSKASKRQAAIYEEQARLNRQIGAFNAQISEASGIEAVNAIAKQTKRTLGEQKVAFSNRGISLEGSPMFVLGDTLTMGSEKAQEAYFNSQVQKINYQYAALGATATATARAEEAKYAGLQSTITAAQQVMGVLSNLNSASKLGISSGFNILKYWQ